MTLKLLLGGGVGAALGYGYHLTMNFCGSQCISQREPAVPIIAGLVLGLFAMAMSRP